MRQASIKRTSSTAHREGDDNNTLPSWVLAIADGDGGSFDAGAASLVVYALMSAWMQHNLDALTHADVKLGKEDSWPRPGETTEQEIFPMVSAVVCAVLERHSARTVR